MLIYINNQSISFYNEFVGVEKNFNLILVFPLSINYISHIIIYYINVLDMPVNAIRKKIAVEI